MFLDRHVFALAVLCYGVSMLYSVFLWRKGFQRDNWVNFGILVGGFLLNGVALFSRGIHWDRCPVNNLYEAMVFLEWTISGTAVVMGLTPKLRFVGAFASPVLFCLGVFALMPSLDVKHGASPDFSNGPTSLHAASIILAYGAFGIASISGAMFLTQDRDLKHNKLRAMLSILPPLGKLERVTAQLMWAGFVLLTIGLVVGAIWVPLPAGKSFFSDLKVIWSLALWGVYLVLLVLHLRSSLRGRRFAWGAVASFAIILLTFWGSNLGSSIHQP